MSTQTLPIVHKDNYDQQHFFDVDQSTLPKLRDSSVRVQSRLLGLSAANLAYCALGRFRGDWGCFPLPHSLPEPYNDSEQYGIAPTWGYAEILESNIPGLTPGTFLWGYVPMSQYPVDLDLEQSEITAAHWSEIGKQRARLQPIYNRYTTVDLPFSSANETKSHFTSCLRITWESAYLLSRFCFAIAPDKPIHPSAADAASWTAKDSDLASTLVIALAAGSRTSHGHEGGVSRFSIKSHSNVGLCSAL